MAETKTTKPKSRGPKIGKKALQEAMKASMVGDPTPEQQATLEAIQKAPEMVYGLSKPEYAKLQAAGTLIHQDGEEQELLLVAQALLLCGLPYKSQTSPFYRRQVQTAQGLVRLTVSASDPDVPLPYGKDRVVLAWVTTKALQNRDPVVGWESASEFFDLFGLDKGGKGYRLFWESWKRLSRAVFTLDIQKPGHDKGRLMPIFEEWDLPSLKDQAKESTGLVRLPGVRYSVTLGERLWQHLREDAIPLRLDIMRLFQDEPKAWDFVGFVCWRSFLCERARAAGFNPVARISWRDLVAQLGSTDKDHKQLRRTLRDILERLGGAWPEMKARFLTNGVLEIDAPLFGVHPVKSRE